ncbi:hypothetical protein AB0I68_06470 [Streptomyces sp. NPDC050448]|uniref:hypothetical protein n=1 Tax=Streptomyces sp. NPDC050448 TaxID=3155404 RepID=UPI00342E0123
MTRRDGFVVNGPDFEPYDDEVPEPAGVRLRSLHLDGWSPTVVLRFDTPRYPAPRRLPLA